MLMLPLVPRERVLDRIACPGCRSRLDDFPAPTLLVCRSCQAEYPQTTDLWADCRPAAWRSPEPTWKGRQDEMESAYADLIADPDHARQAYRNDLEPLRPLFTRLGSRVLDVGGGNGLLRHVLEPATDYVAVDPSPLWLDSRWLAIADAFPCLRAPLAFVGGVGEHLPFPDGAFDAVTSVWSLNHSARPSAVIGEVRRVLAPRGEFVLVLDDVAPRWSDLAAGRYADFRYPTRLGLLRARAAALVKGWPRQPDHLPIAERELKGWTVGLRRIGRGFAGSYLWLRYERRG